MLMHSKMKRGQSMVELALTLPALAVVLVLVADFARAYYASIGVASAARAGVQYGAQNYTTAIDFYSIARRH
jgi:Flp pilus assembly protein TadG